MRFGRTFSSRCPTDGIQSKIVPALGHVLQRFHACKWIINSLLFWLSLLNNSYNFSFPDYFSLKSVIYDIWILAFSTDFRTIKIDLSGNTVWPQLQIFKNLPKLAIFGIFSKLLSTQNVNIARFARIVKWDFFCDFQTLCYGFSINLKDCFNCEIVITMIRSLETWLSIGLLIVFKPFRPPSCFQCHTIC